LRIAHVVASYQPRIGGVETHVRRLAEGCAEAGDEVTVLTHQVEGAPASDRIGAVRVRRFPLTVNSRNYPLSLSLFRHLRSHTADFDVIHVHSYHTLVGHAAHGCSLPLVFTPYYHGTGHTPLRAFLHRLYRPAGAWQFRAADAVICLSTAERDLVVKDFPGVAGKAVTIPSGTDPKLLARDGARAVLDEPRDDPLDGLLDASSDEPLVLTVGRLERYKNVDLIIDAFRALPSSAILVVVGDGPDRARLERRAGTGRSAWPVRFTGRISDAALGRLFARVTVVASASDHEAFGIVLAEGLASGARVVASDIPAHVALARLAGPDAPVALADPRDTRKFTELIAASLSAGRRADDLKLPSWADVVADTRELYSQVRLQGRLVNRRGP
jgi:glycosyltransferase involved in cell wall biosynthesis